MTPEEQGKWDSLQEEMSNMDKRIKSVLDTEKRAKEADEAFDDLSGRPKQAAGAPAQQRNMQDEIRKWARGEDGTPKSLEIRHGAPGPINYRILTGPNNTGSASAIIPTDFYDQLQVA